MKLNIDRGGYAQVRGRRDAALTASTRPRRGRRGVCARKRAKPWSTGGKLQKLSTPLVESANQPINVEGDQGWAPSPLAFPVPHTPGGFYHVRDILPTLFVREWPRSPEDKAPIGVEQLVLPHFLEEWDGPDPEYARPSPSLHRSDNRLLPFFPCRHTGRRTGSGQTPTSRPR